MPKSVKILIIAGIAIGLWSLLPLSQKRPDTNIKGEAVSATQVILPKLSPIPVKKDKAKDPIIDAKNVAIIDVDSGQILFEKNAFAPVPIASLTKLMTAVIIVEENDLQDIVEITKESAFASGSIIGLREGEKITVENLLKGLLIQSGNDAALALAIHNSGSVDKFVTKMNSQTKLLGLKNTTFKDPAGLNDEGVASPRDIAILMSYAQSHSKLTEIVKIPETVIASEDGLITHRLENSNRLVKEELFFPGIIGGKTGFTPTAGHNLVAAAKRNGHTIVSVVINTYSSSKEASAVESRKALDWAFTNHVWLTSE